MFAVLALLFTINISITSVVFTVIAGFFVPCFTAAYDVACHMSEELKNDYDEVQLEEHNDNDEV